MRLIGAVNLVLGMMAGFAALFSGVAAGWGVVGNPAFFFGHAAVNLAIAILGVLSGREAFVNRRLRPLITAAFGVLLLVNAGLLVAIGGFSAARHLPASIYGLAMLAVVAIRKSDKPSLIRCEEGPISGPNPE